MIVGLHQADDHVETGRLACPVRAQQPDNLPALDRQADVPHHLPALVGLGQVLRFENCHY
jgi:hypothetical protein